MSRDYTAPRWLAGAHAQTIYPALFGPAPVVFRRERVDTLDGDFVDFDWQDASGAPGTPTVTIQASRLPSFGKSTFARSRTATCMGTRPPRS